MDFKMLSSKIRDFLFPLPEPCCYCGGERTWTGFCANCWQEICDLQRQEICSICGRVINEQEGCPECRNTTYAFSMARGVGEFQGIIRDLLYQFKYVGRQSLAKPMGSLMAEVVLNQPGFSGAHCLIAIPLANERLEHRKFNQSQLLAVEIAKWVELPVLGGILFRSRETVVQATLGRAERAYNMEG
ncbi:MAG TPA: hypothetical protein VHS59_03865, partial [Bacillota bacterium]|nr:hypothetical protein [Bacillota bacterium]